MSSIKNRKLLKRFCALQKKGLRNLVATVSISFAMLLPSSNAYACLPCTTAVNLAEPIVWEEVIEEFDEKIEEMFKYAQTYIIENIWEKTVLPAMMLSAEQFSVIAMQQAMAVGMFIDAEIQLDSQRLLQELRAKTHKRYHPSVGMCEFGSLMKSVAASELKGEFQAVVLSHRSLDRQLGQSDTAGVHGGALGRFSRLVQFKDTYCNVMNKNNALNDLCDSTAQWSDSNFSGHKRGRLAKDIDYFSLVNMPKTMNIDFTNDDIVIDTDNDNFADADDVNNEDEEHLLAMVSNLYGHDNFARLPSRLLEKQPGQEVSDAQRTYLDMRAIVAKRSVAENSLYSIAALKAKGNEREPVTGPSNPKDPMAARPYMINVLTELGVPTTDEAIQILGDDPSYYAQMEILTKKLYQNPSFYTNLYDKPANVERKATAMQAIKLMQKFDMLESYLRNEASTSILLELAVVELQREVESQIGALGFSGE